MSSPTITIGLPFFNAAEYLANALRSIFSQSISDWELILLDDGSTDDSLEIAASVIDTRVKVFSDGINRGLPYRLNQIAELARGQYVARMDADDVMFPNRLERQLQFLNESPSIDIVGTAVYTINASNEPVGKRGFNFTTTPSPIRVLSRGLFIHPTVMGHVDWFLDNPYDVELRRSEDRELWVRTYTHSHFAHLSEPLLFYREQGSFTLQKYLRNSRYVRTIFRRYGPKSVWLGKTWLLLLKSYFKCLVYILATPIGLQENIIQRRNLPLTKHEFRYALEVIRDIQGCKLPGIDR